MKLKWIIFFSAISIFSFGQDWNIETTLDRDTVLIGEEVGVTFSIHGPANTPFQFLEPEDTSGVMAWLATGDLPISTNHDGFASFKGAFAIFDSGTAALNFKCIVVGSDTLTSNNNFLTIQLVKPIEGKEVADPTDIMKESSWWWIWLILAVGILIILYLISLSKRKKATAPVVAAIEVDPMDIAFKRLSELEKTGMREAKVYYTELSDIIRFAIEKVLHERAEELTSDEIISTLRDGYPKVVAAIAPVLRESDLVKFAKFEPDQLAASRALERTSEALFTIKSLRHVEQ